MPTLYMDDADFDEEEAPQDAGQPQEGSRPVSADGGPASASIGPAEAGGAPASATRGPEGQENTSAGGGPGDQPAAGVGPASGQGTRRPAKAGGAPAKAGRGPSRQNFQLGKAQMIDNLEERLLFICRRCRRGYEKACEAQTRFEQTMGQTRPYRSLVIWTAVLKYIVEEGQETSLQAWVEQRFTSDELAVVPVTDWLLCTTLRSWQASLWSIKDIVSLEAILLLEAKMKQQANVIDMVVSSVFKAASDVARRSHDRERKKKKKTSIVSI